MLELRWLVQFMLERICTSLFSSFSLSVAEILLYSVLLDDCLAAVDSHVARHVFGAPVHPKPLLHI